eukprot:TRINITY_DN22056_c0_g2_i1.p1 TRINITY_DN22056_c0_g2~~TRINITY_DN22056_c0_g2_i1.p1  ORF type:complete len:357 (-),score=16.95 TRINITY_DN22056_c0_g2_i1:283-1353(-)
MVKKYGMTRGVTLSQSMFPNLSGLHQAHVVRFEQALQRLDTKGGRRSKGGGAKPKLNEKQVASLGVLVESLFRNGCAHLSISDLNSTLIQELKTRGVVDSDTTVSDTYVLRMLKSMGYRRRRRVKAPLPSNAHEQVLDFRYRLCVEVKTHGIQPSMVLNLDETFLTVLPTVRTMWGRTPSSSGETQSSSVLAAEHNKGVTGTFVISAEGVVTHLQIISQGKTERSKLGGSVTGLLFDEVLREDSHWASYETFVILMEQIVTYLAGKRGENEYAVVIMDCVRFHVKLRDAWTQKPSWLLLYYLPPNTTSIAQPLDVGFFGVLKPRLAALRRQTINQELVPAVLADTAPNVDLSWSTL